MAVRIEGDTRLMWPIAATQADRTTVSVLVSVLSVLVSLIASAHVVLRKRDTRAAIGWIGLIWLSPFLGTFLYVLLGINRIRRKAQSLRKDRPRFDPPGVPPCPPEILEAVLGPAGTHLLPLVHLVGRVTPQPLMAGNVITPLVNGDETYPAMIEAIEGASRSISLASYIFNDDLAGQRFVEALRGAVGRGVEARVLIDDLGKRYDLPTNIGPLRRAGVKVATFIPTLAPWWIPYLNLRNHRKILVVDGRLGFTGGMNIDKDYDHSLGTRHPKTDLHFRVEGPIVATLQQVFADDWAFSTREVLGGEAWFPPLEPVGDVIARGIAEGPDEELGRLTNTLLGALSCARDHVAIVTPYFLPDAELVAALGVAAMRGVRVDILLPQKNNLNLVQWASTPLLRDVLAGGCRIWLSPPPFDHTKLMVVDGLWSFIGSANWDPRSLRLNFEFNLECYGAGLASALMALFRQKKERAVSLSSQSIDDRHLPLKLRDGVTRLLSPYL